MSKLVEAKKQCCCQKRKTESDRCKLGAWADLEEAKKIVLLGLKGEFLQLEVDSDFPSGFRIGTSYNNTTCSFLDAEGLCSIHKVNPELKPFTCKNFIFERNKVLPYSRILGDSCNLKMNSCKEFHKEKKGG